MIEFIEANQNWQSATTNYWFTVSNQSWALSDCGGDITLLDYKGECNDHYKIKGDLIKFTLKSDDADLQSLSTSI